MSSEVEVRLSNGSISTLINKNYRLYTIIEPHFSKKIYQKKFFITLMIKTMLHRVYAIDYTFRPHCCSWHKLNRCGIFEESVSEVDLKKVGDQTIKFVSKNIIF